MAFLPSQGAEPIPGYRLEKRLGTGGYGEVWQVTAPGGLVKALKIIFGNTADTRAAQELRALNRIKEVRHPFLLSLERVEIIDNQVFIVTELADESLLDRFEACRRSGLPGIPRDELLPYFRDAADALDYMNEQYGLQHLDIKPQNLLLVAKRIKIADFGLVKDLCGTSVTATGGVTPIYASPEAFDNRVSRFSDQYSLAIAYQEMLTGLRPFPGKTTLQLATQHLTSPPLLDPLPAPDRPVIARALAKIPEQRFPTCREMVELLLANSRLLAPAPEGVRDPEPRTNEKKASCFLPPPSSRPCSGTQAQEELLGLDTMAGPPSVAEQPSAEMVDTGPFEELLRKSRTPVGPTRLRPTLFLGLGGLAAAALRHLRQRLHQEFGGVAAVPIFRLLQLDTDRAGFRPPLTGTPGEGFDTDETLWLPLQRPEHYRAEAKDLLRWLDRRWLYGIPRSQLTEGVRSLGRLALVSHLDLVLTQLREVLTQLTSPHAAALAEAATGLSAGGEGPRIFIVAATAGGTGGGMLVDVAYAVRQVLAELHLPREAVYGLLMHGTGQRPSQVDLARVNTYATLTEIHHFHRPDTPYPGDPRHGLNPAGAHDAPFQECYFQHLGDHLSDAQMDAAAREVGEYLFLNATTPVGTFLDRYRENTHSAPAGAGGTTRVRRFGLARLVFPRHALAEAAAHLLCQQVVSRWHGDALASAAARGDDETPKEEAQEQARALGLDAEKLTDRFHAAIRAAWGDAPDVYFGKILAGCVPATSPSAPAQWAEWTQQVLGALDAQLGFGPAREGSETAEAPDVRTAATPLQIVLRDQAEELGAALSRSVMQWLITLMEDPRRRIKAAEAAAGCLLHQLAAVMAGAQSLAADYRVQQDNLRRQLATGDAAGKGAGAGWLGLGNRRPGTITVVQKLPEYCWLRLKDMVMETTVAVLKTVTKRVTQFKQQLPLARQKLTHFAESFQGGNREPAAEVRDSATPSVTELLPHQARTIPEAARVVFQALEPKLSTALDETFQAEVLRGKGGLWGVLSQGNEELEGLADDLLRRARTFMRTALSDIEAARLFQETYAEAEQARQVLQAHLKAAELKAIRPEGWRHLVVALPPGSAATALKELVHQAQPEVPTTFLDSNGDVALCWEATHLPLHQLAAGVIGTEPSYLEIARQVKTRVDVPWTALPG